MPAKTVFVPGPDDTDQEIAEALRAMIDERAAEAPFRVGEAVRVTDAALLQSVGPHLAHAVGAVTSYIVRDRVVHALFFGKIGAGSEMELSLMPAQIEKVAS